MSVVPVVRELAIDHVDTVRETLASQLDKIVLYFLRVCLLAGGWPTRGGGVVFQMANV